MARFLYSFGFATSPLFPQSYGASIEGTEEEEAEIEGEYGSDLVSSPLIALETESEQGCGKGRGQQLSMMATMAAILRRSLVMCKLGVDDEGVRASPEIGCPTNFQHIAHVTFDRFDGFLGLPLEFQTDVLSKGPSASVNVFGVSPESMQCSYDSKGNSIPIILLSMQNHLYSHGGLKTEGIFRINAENGQEMLVRQQLSNGVIPHGVDLHCLACLIKAWFRELPSGVLDSLAPEQVALCRTGDDCCRLVKLLPPVEAALLDWALNLMADVAEHDQYNKMNSRNIAMVFAPNMTQMAVPLTALMHVVQVMNFLNKLIEHTLRERNCAAADFLENSRSDLSSSNIASFVSGSDSDANESFRSFEKRSEVEDGELAAGRRSPISGDFDYMSDGSMHIIEGRGDSEGLFNRLDLRNRVQRLCSHPVFQLSRASKKAEEIKISGEVF